MGTINKNREELRNEDTYEVSIFKKIDKILGGNINTGKLVSKTEKKAFRKNILKILNENKDNKELQIYIISEVDPLFYRDNKELQKNKEITKLAISKDPFLFYDADITLQNDLSIGKELLKSIIRHNWDFDTIEGLINKYFKNYKKDLIDFYFLNLKKANIFYKDDLSKSLFDLKEKKSEVFLNLKKSGLIDSQGKDIKINEKILKDFVKNCLKNTDFLILDKENQDKYIEKYLLGIFVKNLKDLSKEEKYIFDLIINLLNIEFSKHKRKIIKEYELDNEKTNKKDDKVDNDEKNDNNVDNVEEFDDILDFSYPQCSSIVVSGGYKIETITGKEIFISDSEKNNFTSKALANYINFYNTLHNLGLNFLWDKYLYDFKILCKNKIGFNYMKGEGITEGKTLAVLNMIGKNIGIPEHEVLDGKGKTKNIYKCFSSLADAKGAFGEIKETGIINGEKYSNPGTLGNGAVENKLIELFCIDPKGNGLNISKWR